MNPVSVIGAGLAGCEAAWQLAQAGIPVNLYEMKPERYTPAHKYQGFAELVCSNSLKAARIGSAAGMLKEEMRILGSLTMACAAKSSVGAGGALAVDRKLFSDLVTEQITSHPNIQVITGEVTQIPEGYVIIATGPLTSDDFADCIFQLVGGKRLSFYDAAAPIVTAESIDMEKAYFAARYGRGDADYINCGMNEQEYKAFYQELIHGEVAPLHEFDRRDFKVYEGCMPVEVMAKRGEDTLRFGPLKPVGLNHPETGQKYYAVLQLRKENTQGSMYNLVGFQTNLKFGEQKRIFSMIPGLENAEFVRYGVMHRNTFLDSPRLLDNHFRLKQNPRILFAGQITGVEGYVESAASGIYAGLTLANQLNHKLEITLPQDTMLGALSAYISNPMVEDFQPMGANMGILPPLTERIKNKQLRYETIAARGLESLHRCLEESV
ncbi:MAG: methylenetetrahydrofolate--tRNA-(uracil(54)-C(5))-methyltransferase (FADH(2)-oxidizing) TrmFO [Massilioclostridium sp.]|nr:MAG: methylenetetrahydrofolate--tRNA-(uracil(54)-C(5))-methyltransferase (FADH(2)-oxidizing) TrmFO [Massilioclostridium sp.]PWM99532.1 MAG: methylenetetrahydrofolate--tRNA-(uracil(54)-C(5))-methyltransferase (FADH(2)-oxidizing) TrmFO [Massilioclostridium sp.]